MDSLLQNLLLKEHLRYLDFFSETIASLKNGKSTFATELLLESNDKTLLEPFNLFRVDFISKKEDGEYSISDIRMSENLSYDVLV